ncbi:hypothetical protein [Flavisolibacter tropicus]|uniref:Uncharacterized protein n=1 Tax=Flavisolibacter tropicus TaxID=1492898 RepID=A0A172TY60_9BACT|nr:hypothetical protein [Flavisolibacter tropicus]ANE51946.1 hypothetical protein SY85_17055 [Flavisolibacter tropicus]
MKRLIPFLFFFVACKGANSKQDEIQRNAAIIKNNNELYDSESSLYTMYMHQGNPKAQDHEHIMDSLRRENDSLLNVNTELLKQSGQ